MVISAVCPVLNEEKDIRHILDFFLRALPEDKELLIIDGGSEDKTLQIVQSCLTAHPNIVLIHNPEKFVSFALNHAIPLCRGKFIIRLDGHTTYADDYFEKVVEVFERSGADIVGGPMRASGSNVVQEAVAYATSTSFGVGNSSFHFEGYEGPADSVYLGAWKSEIFTRTGLFDTMLKRNQDDEFHYRAKSLGYKIYQSPLICSWYQPRSSLSGLFRQYFEYGIFKPLVLRKVNRGFKIRHVIPSLFLLYLLSLPILLLIMGAGAFLPGLVYVLLDFWFSFANRLGIAIKFTAWTVYPVLHVSYGTGFIVGLLKLPKYK